MNKHYDRYLCRAKERPYIEISGNDGTISRVYLDNDTWCWKFDYNNLSTKRIIKQDVDFKAMFEQGQMDCIKLGFKFYGWVFAGIFALAALLFSGFSIK